MNILILISSLTIGGAEKQAVNDANMLSSEHNIYLSVFKDGLLKTNVGDGVQYNIVKKSGYIKTARLIAGFVKEKNIDVIHASLFAPMIIAAIVGFITKKPVIWSFHSHEYDIPLKSKLSFFIFSRIGTVKKILFVNNELKSFFEKRLKFPKPKTSVLYNTSEFLYLPEPTFNRSKYLNIGYVGRLVELKRVRYLIDLTIYLLENEISNFRIQIYGDGESRKELEEMVKEKVLDNYIVFHGFKTELEQIYQNFDIFINPSREECLSIALIDAGSNGIASVAFDVGGNDEIIINDQTGYIVKTKEQMFEKTLELIINKSLRSNFGVEAKKHCLRNFAEDVRKQNLTQIFNSVT